VGGTLELAGEAYLPLIGGTTTIELRRWPRGATRPFEANAVPTPDLRDFAGSYPAAGFDVAIDLSTAADGRPLAAGSWEIWLSVGTDMIRRAAPLRAPRQDVRGRGIVVTGDRAGRIALYQTPVRELRLRIGRRPRAASWLEHAEFGYLRVRRRVGIAVPLLVGRRLSLSIRRAVPGIVARLEDD
jgi:hypothetical protein